MPRKNVVKEYVANGYYHIYNRGVDKSVIFKDEQDYAVFLKFLKEYLLPPNHPELEKLRLICPTRNPINCHDEIVLNAFCLLPNHYHLFVKQITDEGLKTFMKALNTNYSMYFNKKYDRVGPLFQGTYKAILVRSESYLVHLSRYIHLNPRETLKEAQKLEDYPYSSYGAYLGKRNIEWVDRHSILEMFGRNIGTAKANYKNFVEADLESGEDDSLLPQNLAIES